MKKPDLANYGALIIDEAHERTIPTDILLALVKDVTKHRLDLKLLISSVWPSSPWNLCFLKQSSPPSRSVAPIKFSLSSPCSRTPTRYSIGRATRNCMLIRPVWPLSGRGGDHVTLLNIWEQWKRTNFSRQFCYERFLQFKSMCRARDVREQLVNICQRAGVPMSSNANSTDLTPVQKTLTAGFFYNTAELRRSDDSYIALKTKQVAHVHPSSSLFGQLPPAKAVLYYEVVMTSKAYMRQVMEIKPSWLRTTSNSPTLSNW